MTKEKMIELTDDQLHEVNGGGRKRTYGYQFTGNIDKYAVEGYIGKKLYFEGEGHHYAAMVLNSAEEDDGCGTVRKHRIKVIYDYDKRKKVSSEQSVNGDSWTAYTGLKLL